MKKILCVLLALILCFGLAACKPDTPPVIDTPTDGQTGTPDMPETPDEPGDKTPAEEPFEANIILADFELKKLITFVSAFNTYPMEFTSAGQLDDYALFFAAVTRMNAAFTPLSDGMTYSLPILELETAVREIFGSGVSLSDAWTQNNYDPYSVDTANGVVYKGSMGSVSTLLYPYQCVKTDDGLRLTMLNLADPLFADKYPEVGDASEVTPDMVADIAADMMAYVYTVQQNRDGGYTLTGFAFRNPKELGGLLM